MSIPENVCRVSMRDYMSDPDISRKVLEGLHLNGFAFIEGVQATQQNTEFVIRQLFPIHKTLFGEMWTFSDEKKDHMDTAYTNCKLFKIVLKFYSDYKFSQIISDRIMTILISTMLLDYKFCIAL